MTDAIERRSPPRRSGPSIRVRLALLMSGLAVVLIGGFSAAAYRQARQSAISAASERLVSVRAQLGNMFVSSMAELRAQAGAAAADSVIKSFLRSPTPDAEVLVRATLERSAPSSRQTLVAAELWDASGRRVLAMRDTLTAMPPESVQPHLALVGGTEQTAVGWIVNRRGALRYIVIARVADGVTTLGYVVQRRLLTASPEAPRQASELIGSNARALLGNTRGDLWTDFNAVTAPPPVSAQQANGPVQYARGDTAAVLAIVSPIAGTPWSFAVEFPRARVLGPAHTMLWQLGLVAVLLLLLAGGGAWLLSAGLARPIADLANAAEAISAGDYSRRVDSARSDELGALGAAFNRMSLSIKDAQHDTASKMVALEDSETRYRALFESNPHPMWVYDIETLRFLAVNDAAVRRYGYSREEFLRMSIVDIRPETELPKLLATLDQVDMGVNGEVWRHRTKDGSVMDVEVSSRSLVFGGRRARLVHAHDLTERRRAEESLRATQERLQRVIASSGAVIFELRLRETDVELEWISENLTTILGYTVDDAKAPAWWSRNVHPDDRKRFPDRPGSGAYKDGSAEYRFRHKNGTWRWLREEQRVLTNTEDTAGTVIGAWLDITDWRQLEEQFHQSQKMEAIGRLAGGVAHDFNNLLTVVLAEADLVLMSPSLHDAEHRESLGEIKKSAERATILTRQLLTFSRRQLIEPTAVNLNDIVSGIDKMLRRLIGDVRISLKLNRALHETVADRGQIEQVLVNLVVNARDAMPKGGALTIETENVRLDGTYAGSHADVTAGDYVMLGVSDSGSGMSDDVKAHLFEPFFTTKEPGKGTGLGLATCFAIARQFGGHIGVYSEPGVGTTMRIYLPRVHAPADSRSAAAGAVTRGGNETILIVEDEPQVRRVAVRMLNALGYSVREASDAEEAIAFLDQPGNGVDLVLTDVVLPKMGGLALATRILEMRPGTRVLFASGYSDDMVLQHQLLDGEMTLLQKPFTVESLAEKVREVLDRPIAAV